MAPSDHSRQMSSLSMNTFTTTSQSQHYPTEPLLHDPERMEPTSRHAVPPDPVYVGSHPLGFLLVQFVDVDVCLVSFL